MEQFDDPLPHLEPELMMISVLIPQFGQSGLTIRAVESLCQHHVEESLEILVIDDGSTASERRALFALDDKRVRVLLQPRRLGVTAAWNRAACQAQGDVLIFLNNDTVTTGNWCDRLAAELDVPEARIVGPEWRVTSEVEQQVGKPRKVLSGWCLGMSRVTFQALQGFDERFQLYFSDTDLQWRACERWPNCLATIPAVPLQHLGHQTTRRWTRRRAEWRRDQQEFLRRWGRAESPAGGDSASGGAALS